MPLSITRQVNAPPTCRVASMIRCTFPLHGEAFRVPGPNNDLLKLGCGSMTPKDVKLGTMVKIGLPWAFRSIDDKAIEQGLSCPSNSKRIRACNFNQSESPA